MNNFNQIQLVDYVIHQLWIWRKLLVIMRKIYLNARGFVHMIDKIKCYFQLQQLTVKFKYPSMQSLDTVKSESSTLNKLTTKQNVGQEMVEDVDLQQANFDDIQNQRYQNKKKVEVDAQTKENTDIGKIKLGKYEFNKKRTIIIGSIFMTIIILASITIPIGIIFGNRTASINSNIKTEILSYKGGEILQSIQKLSSTQQLQAVVTINSLVVSNPYQQTSIKKIQVQNANIFQIFCNPLTIISTTLQITDEQSAEQNARKNKWIDQYNKYPQLVYETFISLLFQQFQKLQEKQPNFSGTIGNFAQSYMIYVQYDTATSTFALASYDQGKQESQPSASIEAPPQNSNNQQLSPYLLEALKNSTQKLINQISIGVQFLEKKSFQIIQQQKKYREGINISQDSGFLQFCIGSSLKLFLCPWDIVREKFHVEDSNNLVSSSVTTFSLSI